MGVKGSSGKLMVIKDFKGDLEIKKVKVGYDCLKGPDKGVVGAMRILGPKR